ncbi:MAG: hypothetical protein KDD03_04580 [Gelidibacter sp.]|nr:hypothetical protein [Gelidibacter sp.]
MNLQKIIKIAVLIIGVIALFFLIRIMMIGDEVIEADASQQGIVSSFITLAIITLAITTIITLLFSVKNLLSSPAKLKQALIAVGLFALVVIVAFVMSSGTEQALDGGDVLTASESRWIETGIRTFYILVIAAAGAMMFSGVKKMMNK